MVHGDPVFDCLKGAKTPTFLFHPGFTSFPPQAVLHEVYPLGNSFVKAVKSEFALAKVCQALGLLAGSSTRTSEILNGVEL